MMSEMKKNVQNLVQTSFKNTNGGHVKIDGIQAREKEEVVCREADIIRIFMARTQDIKMEHIKYNPEVQDEEILQEGTQKPDLKLD